MRPDTRVLKGGSEKSATQGLHARPELGNIAGPTEAPLRRLDPAPAPCRGQDVP